MDGGKQWLHEVEDYGHIIEHKATATIKNHTSTFKNSATLVAHSFVAQSIQYINLLFTEFGPYTYALRNASSDH